MNKRKISENDYPIKGYFHFDYPVHISKVKSYVQNHEKIAGHSFFPLIAYEQENEKYSSDIFDYTDGRPYKNDPRPIKYAGHLDGYIYKYYAKQLNYAYNKWAIDNKIDDNSIAYRTNKKGKSNIDFAAEVINYIANNDESFILVGDFKSYFNTFNHHLLKEKMYKVLVTDHLTNDWFNVFKSVTKYGFVEKKDVEEYFGDEGFLRQQGYRKFIVKDKTFSDFRKEYKIKTNKPNKKGVPQGVPISAVMANVYAIDFDRDIKSIVEENHGIYRRYSDDFIIVIPKYTKGIKYTEVQFKKLVYKIRQIAAENKLEIAENKTHTYRKINNNIYEIFEDFSPKRSYIDYLGFIYDGSSVTIRQKSIERFYRRMKKTVRAMERKKKRNNRKENKPKMKRIPHRDRIYGLFTDRGFKRKNGRSKNNFIKYVKRSQKKFDNISPNTNNEMLDQIKNRKKKLEALLGERIYVRQIDKF